MIFEDLEESKIDLLREKVKGFSEIVYGEFKSAQQIVNILEVLIREDNRALVTRVSNDKWEEIEQSIDNLSYHEDAGIIVYEKEKNPAISGEVLVVSAGTSDYKVVAEAEITAKWMGCQVNTLNDVGVAGIGRMISYLDEIRRANVIICVAGMEGALPSVISGLVETPVLAVPTSVGYGANDDGMTTMLAMLSSCSSGISVVNINNGFGAAYQAAIMLKQIKGADSNE